jgi:hypothetical protein
MILERPAAEPSILVEPITGHGLPVLPPHVGANKLWALVGTTEMKANSARAKRLPAKNFLMIDIISLNLHLFISYNTV